MINFNENSFNLDFPPCDGEISQPFIWEEGVGEADPNTFWIGLSDNKVLILKPDDQKVVNRGTLPSKPDACVYLGEVAEPARPNFSELNRCLNIHQNAEISIQDENLTALRALACEISLYPLTNTEIKILYAFIKGGPVTKGIKTIILRESPDSDFLFWKECPKEAEVRRFKEEKIHRFNEVLRGGIINAHESVSLLRANRAERKEYIKAGLTPPSGA